MHWTDATVTLLSHVASPLLSAPVAAMLTYSKHPIGSCYATQSRATTQRRFFMSNLWKDPMPKAPMKICFLHLLVDGNAGTMQEETDKKSVCDFFPPRRREPARNLSVHLPLLLLAGCYRSSCCVLSIILHRFLLFFFTLVLVKG